MRDWLAEPNPIRTWQRAAHRAEVEVASATGKSWAFRDMPWGTTGPKALWHFQRQSSEEGHAVPPELFYPVFLERVLLLF